MKIPCLSRLGSCGWYPASALALFAVACGSGQPDGPVGAGAGAGNPATMGTAGTGGSGGAGGVQVVNGGSGGVVVLPPGEANPGRVTAHRLNTREYDNTIRDLVGLDLKPSGQFSFPEDDWAGGFTNNADLLSVSPISLEKYLEAAQAIAEAALDPANAAARAGIVTCDVATGPACTEAILSEFARRAFRRPIEAGELASYVALIDLATTNGDTAETGLKLALAAILTAPDFLFRIELDPVPGVVRQLNGFEVASRLSYFIWSSMPDEELFTRALDNTLTDPAQIAAQVQRMLADPKATALSDVLVEQWMYTAKLPEAVPSVEVFPTWQPALIPMLDQELRAFFAPIITGQAPGIDLLTASYVYVNRTLGTFYGIPGAEQLPEDQFTRVEVTDGRRGGVLRGGNFLVATSKPESHSPTKRGKWVLDRLLCVTPPPPPGGVPEFEPTEVPDGTLRQKLIASHLVPPDCASCHTLIDPIGFAFEHYDGVGLWRDVDNNLPVDATGALPGTQVTFNGAAELSAAIAVDPRFEKCVTKNILTYATGRKMTADDQIAIDDIGSRFVGNNYNMPSLIEYVATSNAMTLRQTESAQ